MKTKHCLTTTLGLFTLAVVASITDGQGMQAPASTSPVVTFVAPVGGQAGTTFELRVAGANLTDVTGLHFNFPGVKVEIEGATTEKGVADKDKKGKVKGAPPAIQGQKFKVTLPANAPVGIHDVRIVTKGGISNPRAFVVSNHKEFAEEEPNNDVPQAQKIELNSSVSGGISVQTDVDFYTFTGKKGQRVLCSCLTTSIDSRLQVELQLYGPGGVYLGNDRNYSNNDALLDTVLPSDGEYYVRVHGFAYQNAGPDYFYRLTVSTAPWIDAIYPPVVEPGKATQVTIYGRNLPGGKADPEAMVNGRALDKLTVTVKTPSDAKALQRLATSNYIAPTHSMLDGFDYRVDSPAGPSNPYLLTYANAPVVLDNGDNDSKETAQKINVPCVIAGKIEKKADRDWYAFTAKKGQVLHFEAFAERIGAPMDLYFQIRDERNSLVTEQDDHPEVLATQFYTRMDDPAKYRFVAPADGTFYLLVTARDAFTQYGVRNLYTVHVTAEQPDFRLIAMATSSVSPEANVVNQGGGAAFNVYVWRFGGFNDEIVITGENLPPGVGVQPQVITGGQKVAALIVHGQPNAPAYNGPIQIVGTATVKGTKLVREVRAASVTWPVQQNNIPTITRIDREIAVAVREKAPYTLAVKSNKISINIGEKVAIPFTVVPDGSFKSQVFVTAQGGPPGFTSQPVTVTPGQGGTATFDLGKGANTIMPGNYTVFLRGGTQQINPKQPPPKGAAPNIQQFSMPVTLTIVPKQLGKVTAAPLNAKVAAGKEVEITVRVARQYELPASFKVEAILPAGVKGVTAQPVTIKADEDEAKMIIRAEPGAAVPAMSSVTIRFTSMFNETIPIVQEAKLTLSLGK